jgi:hypothetical protein
MMIRKEGVRSSKAGAPDAEKPRPGVAGASAALPACRSDRRICIVGGHNDATSIVRPFYSSCNSYFKY